MQYVLFDSFNKCVISRHRTVEAAAKAKAKFFRDFYKNNTKGSYLPVSLMQSVKGELEPVSDEDADRFYRIEAGI
jgi:hypothetical protein